MTTVCWLVFLLAVLADWVLVGWTEAPEQRADSAKVPMKMEIERRSHSRADVWTLHCQSDADAADFLVELSK